MFRRGPKSLPVVSQRPNRPNGARFWWWQICRRSHGCKVLREKGRILQSRSIDVIGYIICSYNMGDIFYPYYSGLEGYGLGGL